MLTKDEEVLIYRVLGRMPNLAERAVFDALWSEHCSYKSSKRWFHLFKTESKRVRLGIGEGAGLIDVGNGYVVGIGLESHNHPSAIDPFNGAATGVGGIIRDIVSQGCRPIAVLDCLRFGYPTTPKQKLLLDQVVLGISSYGNCVGIPNVGGDIEFAKEFEGNPLVNAMCVGIAKEEKIIRSVAKNKGDLLLLFGATTGRDGIGGVTFASEELDDDSQSSRSSVQIGDPLTEKLLIDVVLEMRNKKILNGLQDLGGGGLVCAAAEMAEKGNTGVELELTKVHVREKNMKGWEILVSESQERMLATLPENNLEEAVKIIEKNALSWSIVGKVTDTQKLVANFGGKKIADIPIDFLINGFPEPMRIEGERVHVESHEISEKSDDILLSMLSSFNIISRRPIFEQYDQQVQGNTVITPGGDAGVLFLPNGKYLAIAAGTNSYLVSKNPRVGAALATLQIIRSVICRGALPIGMVDSVNAGNPEKSSSYKEFVDVLRGVAEVSQEIEIPIVGGNVSLYNEKETKNCTKKILPSPFVGVVGLIEKKPIHDKLIHCASYIFQVGETPSFLEGTQYQRIYGGDAGRMNVNYDSERRANNFILSIDALAATDVGRGGLITTLAKWAIRSDVGCKIQTQDESPQFLWGENSARYLVQIEENKVDAFIKKSKEEGVPIQKVALITDAKSFHFSKTYFLDDLRRVWEKPMERALQI